MDGEGSPEEGFVFEPHKKLLSPDMVPISAPWDPTWPPLFPFFSLGSLPSSVLSFRPLWEKTKRQWNSHQKPQAHGKEIRALGILLPGGSEASPPAWLLRGMGCGGCVLTLAASYVKHQPAGGQPEQAGQAAPIWALGGGDSAAIPACVRGQGHSQAVTICCRLKRPGQGPGTLEE